MTKYHAPVKVNATTYVDGEPRDFVFDGEVVPGDEVEAALAADLHAVGVLTAPPAKSKSKPADEE